MPYTQFTTIAKAKQAFDLTVQEGSRFIPPLSPIAPSDILSGTLRDSLPIVATSGSEKARSEGIIVIAQPPSNENLNLYNLYTARIMAFPDLGKSSPKFSFLRSSNPHSLVDSSKKEIFSTFETLAQPAFQRGGGG